MAAAEPSSTDSGQQQFPRFGGVHLQDTPDPSLVRDLYVNEHLTEKEIARRLRVSRALVAEALAAAGVERRRPLRVCPISDDALAALFLHEHFTVAEIARRLGAAHATVERWLSTLGLGEPDPRIDHARLYRLYVEERQTVRETAAAFGVSHARIQRELGLAGITPRPAYERRPRDARARVTPEVLTRLYVEEGHSLKEVARQLGVSDEYLGKQLRAHGIAKRLGGFTARLPGREALAARAVQLYQQGLTMHEVAEQLSISATTVRIMLHESKVAVRPGGPQRVTAEEHAHRLLRDLYGDKDVVATLVAHGVVLQDPEHWRRAGPTEVLAPIPLEEDLVVELYSRLGLSTFHIGLVCGVNGSYVRARLQHFGVALRSPALLCPWMVRTYGRTSPKARRPVPASSPAAAGTRRGRGRPRAQ